MRPTLDGTSINNNALNRNRIVPLRFFISFNAACLDIVGRAAWASAVAKTAKGSCHNLLAKYRAATAPSPARFEKEASIVLTKTLI